MMSSARCRIADEIPLAQFNAGMAQYSVSHGKVEIEVRQREAEKIIGAVERELAAAGRNGHFPGFRAIDVLTIQLRQQLQRPVDPELQIVESFFRIVPFRGL